MTATTNSPAFSFEVNLARPTRTVATKEKAARLPRLSRLLALAIKLDRHVRDGAIRDYAELARLGHVSRARISQLMNLLLLAPDIQEEILFLPPTCRGRDPICVGQLQAIALVPTWSKQRRLWRQLKRR